MKQKETKKKKKSFESGFEIKMKTWREAWKKVKVGINLGRETLAVATPRSVKVNQDVIEGGYGGIEVGFVQNQNLSIHRECLSLTKPKLDQQQQNTVNNENPLHPHPLFFVCVVFVLDPNNTTLNFVLSLFGYSASFLLNNHQIGSDTGI